MTEERKELCAYTSGWTAARSLVYSCVTTENTFTTSASQHSGHMEVNHHQMYIKIRLLSLCIALEQAIHNRAPFVKVGLVPPGTTGH